MLKGRFAAAAQHPRDLFLPRFAFHLVQPGKGAAAHHLFCYHELVAAAAATCATCVMQST